MQNAKAYALLGTPLGLVTGPLWHIGQVDEASHILRLDVLKGFQRALQSE